MLVQPVRAQTGAVRAVDRLLAAARGQIGVTVRYDPAYVRLAFPGGDVDRAHGVCTDVIVRAYRVAFDTDLQALVNADMRRAFASYPQLWGLKGPDPNIDHRRVANLQRFFERANAKLDVPWLASGWQAGDLVTSMIDGRLPHIGIVSDKVAGGRPLVIHNIGAGAREEDALLAHPITGRFRWRLEA